MVDSEISMQTLLDLEEIDFKNRTMTAKINGNFVSMKKYDSTFIKENDIVWIIQFSPGG